MSLQPPIPLHELALLQDSEDRWLFPRVIPRFGRVIIYGHSNLGKSFVALDLAMALATGTEFLGEFAPTRTGTVLFASTEGDTFTNRDRYLWVAAAHEQPDLAKVPIWHMQEPALLDDPGDRQQMLAFVARIHPILVVLDPLDSFFWGDEDKAWTTKPVRHFLDSLVRDHGCTVLLVHHAAAKEDNGARKPRGSTAWLGWADTVVRAHAGRPARRGSPPVLILDVIKQRNGPKGELARVVPRIDEAAGLVTFPPVGVEAHGTLLAQIAQVLREQGPLTTSQVRAACGGRFGTVQAALEALRTREVVELMRLPARPGLRSLHAWAYVNALDTTTAAQEAAVEAAAVEAASADGVIDDVDDAVESSTS